MDIVESERTGTDFVLRVQKAMEKLPATQTGLVMGSGKNTADWKSRGWLTLDIESKYKADYTGDARDAPKLFTNLGYLVAERLAIKERPGRFEVDRQISETITEFVFPRATGISKAELARVADSCLSRGGVFVFVSVEREGEPSRWDGLGRELSQRGFEVQTQYGEWNDEAPPIRDITGFARKR